MLRVLFLRRAHGGAFRGQMLCPSYFSTLPTFLTPVFLGVCVSWGSPPKKGSIRQSHKGNPCFSRLGTHEAPRGRMAAACLVAQGPWVVQTSSGWSSGRYHLASFNQCLAFFGGRNPTSLRFVWRARPQGIMTHTMSDFSLLGWFALVQRARALTQRNRVREGGILARPPEPQGTCPF